MINPEGSLIDTKPTPEQIGVVNKKVTRREEEKWEVAQLKGDIAPCSRPSYLFDELEERRKSRHDNLLRQLTEDLQAINLKMENNVKLSSEELKAHMKYFNDKLQGILQIVDVSEVTSYDNSVFLEFQIKANEYKSEQQKLIDELYDDLIKFENERTSQNQKLLQAACEEMTKIGYLLPYEIQTFVEREVLALNQLSLNNRRNYEDLKLTLTLVTEQTFKSFADKVVCIKEKWFQWKLLEALTNKQSDAENKILCTVTDCYSRLELKGQELILELSPITNCNTCKAEEWSRNVQNTVAAIETHGKELIEISKKMINGIYQNFDQEAEDIRRQLNLVQPLDIELRTIKPIIFESQKELEDLESYWQDNLADITIHLKDLNQFLMDMGNIWDRHSERLCESQKLIAMALNKADESSQGVLQDLEVKLNIALDALRQEHNKNDLEKCYEAVVTILNSIKANYESMYLNDVSIIEDYYKMMNLEADVLSAEFKEFIYEVHPLDPTRILHCYGDPHRTFPDTTQIVKVITGCVQRVKAIKQWRFGIWSALCALSDKTRETLQPKAEQWVQKKIECAADKKSLQLELVEKRYGRIRTEILEKRMREIETHEELLEKHKKKILFVYNQLKGILESLEEKELEKLNKMKEELDEAQEKARQEDRPGVIHGKQLMAQRTKEEFEEGIKSNFEKFRVDCESKIYDLKQANINYIKSIKLFHEGGNYSAEEGKKYATTLEGLDKEFNAELKNFTKESSKKESDILKKASAIFVPPIALFSSLYEETSFKWEIGQRFQFFERELLEITETLTSDSDLLDKKNSCLSNLVNNRSKPLNENLYKYWNSMLRLLYLNFSSLFFPIEFPETPVPSVKGEEEKGESAEGEFFSPGPCCCNARFPVKLINSKTFTFRTTEADENFTCKDFKNELFGWDTEPKNNGTFMGAVQYRLWTMLDTLQKVACAFYKKLQGRKIIRSDLIPPNYEALIKDILVRLRSYYSQFEKLWLRAVLDFLPVLGRLKTVANAYVERKLNDYDYTVQAALKTYEDNFVTCLEDQSINSQKEFEALERKLLTLYGYPQNQDLLSCLEEEVVRRTAGLGVSWESTIKKFKSHVKCFRIHHVGERFEIRKIESHYLKLKNTLFIYDLGVGLLDTIMSYCDIGGFCPHDMLSDPSAKMKDKTTPIDTAVLEEYDLGLDPDDKWATSEWYLNQLRDIVERERFTGDRQSECPPCPEGSVESYLSEELDFCTRLCAPPLHILLEPLDFDQLSEEILKRLNSSLGRLKAFALSQENVHEEALFRWLNTWKINVKKVQKVYHVKDEGKLEPQKETTPTETENDKPKTEKTSASVALTLPRLCPETKLELKNATSNIPKLKSRFLESKRVSDENSERPGLVKTVPENLYKSKLIENTNINPVKYLKNSSLIIISPRNYHGQIPLLKRHSLSALTMLPPITRFPSPLKKNSPKDKQNKMKTISFEQETKKSTKSSGSRTSSPVRSDRPPLSYKKSKQRPLSPTTGNLKNVEKTSKRWDVAKTPTSPRINSRGKNKSKAKQFSSTNLDLIEEAMVRSVPVEEANLLILKQSSQPSLCKPENLIQPQEKLSLDHLKDEVYTGDHGRLSFEKVHLCIEKKEVKTLSLGERKRSYLLTYSSEDLQNDDNISLSFLKNLSKTTIKAFSKEDNDKNLKERNSKNVIRTLSGQELILTPSMKLHSDKGEVGCDDVEISELLNETEGQFDGQKEVHIPQDEASEYDSEVSTDGELAKDKSRQQSACRVASYKDMQKKSMTSFWKSREAEILNDVDYRQSVYHPAVSRRHKDADDDDEDDDVEFRPKSKSIENNFEFADKSSESIIRSRSQMLKNDPTGSMGSSHSEQSWATPFDKTDGKESYTNVLKTAPLYDVKRVRTNKERISGALLHFTLKIIRLLAIFNLWPGDNCYILTSQSLRFAR